MYALPCVTRLHRLPRSIRAVKLQLSMMATRLTEACSLQNNFPIGLVLLVLVHLVISRSLVWGPKKLLQVRGRVRTENYLASNLKEHQKK